ncbi:MAG: hypothetical protein AB7O56_11280 [Bauldia sp.]
MALRHKTAALATLLAAALAFLAAAPAAAYVVIGDSLGVGVGWAGHPTQSLAANSVRITGNAIINQINSLPRDTLAFMSLGTNDAVGNVVNVQDAVNGIVAAARARNVTLVWIGPPCVFKDWDGSAAQLDTNLAQQLRGLGVIYVSMRDPGLCDRSVRAADGVHFTMSGYERMWALAAAAAGIAANAPAAVAAAPAAPAPVVYRGVPTTTPPLPVPNPIRVAGATPGGTPVYAQQAAMVAVVATVPMAAPAPVAVPLPVPNPLRPIGAPPAVIATGGLVPIPRPRPG